MEPKLVVIVGETASGKSGVAFSLAQKFNGEIISADSWAVYKDFNIGTAKPGLDEQAKIPHHLIDVADPTLGFSAAEFKKLAKQTIIEVADMGKLPIVVGGTGLYIDSLIYDYGFLPAGDQNERQKLDNMSLEELSQIIKNRKINTTGIDVRNKRRLVRLIQANGQRPGKQDLRPNTLIIGLSIDRKELERRVTYRIDQMINAGLEKEVKNLSKKFGWGIEPMKGIGYREWEDYFASKQTLEQTRQQIIIDTLHLAKKQRTWFKRNNSIHWITNIEQAITLVNSFLNT